MCLLFYYNKRAHNYVALSNVLTTIAIMFHSTLCVQEDTIAYAFAIL